MIDRGEEHLGAERAARYLRKFYPWYLEGLGGAGREDADRYPAKHRTTLAGRPGRCSPSADREPVAGPGRR